LFPAMEQDRAQLAHNNRIVWARRCEEAVVDDVGRTELLATDKSSNLSDTICLANRYYFPLDWGHLCVCG
jgi:hypothetical protein